LFDSGAFYILVTGVAARFPDESRMIVEIKIGQRRENEPASLLVRKSH
jgi:hypothetical protein